MTKSTITRERLEKIKSWRETYGAGSNVILPAEEAEELARMALAAMDSDPVAYTDERNLGYIDRGRETAYLWGKQNSEPADVALYRHAQPAPVVPDEMTPEMMRAVQLNSELGAYAASNLSGAYDLFAEFWKVACRAAMLQAEPVTTANKLGNSPVIGIDPASSPDRTVEVHYLAPPGYVMVPKEPTESMINAWLSEVANWRGHVAGYKAMLEATQPAPTIQVTNAMAYAFHHALTDGPLGDDDVEDIKTGLRAAFATVTIRQPAPVVPVEATTDNKPNSSYEWRKGWNACLAAMLAVAPPAPKSTVK
ncbi:hypothetical protein [Klebsiella oxytoca]|uniref:hypothetical protein n=1 Tax=Klebsiella oxytoca TaxID=571 RepID=UPI0007CBC9DA|nr:hypothetical protein [Klebsiella oxytoca]SBM18674.1 Uncharacterised protein [Klebsiella oxytoca]